MDIFTLGFETNNSVIFNDFLEKNISTSEPIYILQNKFIPTQLNRPLELRLSMIKQIKDFFLAEINEREKMRKTLNNFK